MYRRWAMETEMLSTKEEMKRVAMIVNAYRRRRVISGFGIIDLSACWPSRIIGSRRLWAQVVNELERFTRWISLRNHGVWSPHKRRRPLRSTDSLEHPQHLSYDKRKDETRRRLDQFATRLFLACRICGDAQKNFTGQTKRSSRLDILFSGVSGWTYVLQTLVERSYQRLA
ncbi:uncharacterized protein ARMOST_12250 [Armillaria ostoyae]|uniref:Uncharacterized protein n=1 Tax=Armillaria ostoyae TaxID=47428 RepID=A0A284RJC8_ARMOS|nr:uncharacterized protein ARMOST_12250 [Armillaria ostoyae]